MDQRVVQISRCVEELLTTANELLNAKEEEDSQQTSRQPPTSNATRQLMEQLLLTHRQVNGACDSLYLDLQESEIILDRLISQGWQPANPGDVSTSGACLLPTEHAESLSRLDAAAASFLLIPHPDPLGPARPA
uniref:Mediator of RNA polymerase II transcription subunit 11 n=1 Tax=Cryptomonas curvata TaxID=233186 RepID=A0A7S0QSX7_9CRYP|mmetsp:Transcript_49900/g.104125  ORF Transcript_49900/g.104125 Transcript_49900/m.104125 type:complete len:134 (+) Transcript_49900:22-423(+)